MSNDVHHCLKPENATYNTFRYVQTLDPTILVDEIKVFPPCMPLDDVPSRYEVEEAVRAMANRKAVGPDGLPTELLKATVLSSCRSFVTTMIVPGLSSINNQHGHCRLGVLLEERQKAETFWGRPPGGAVGGYNAPWWNTQRASRYLVRVQGVVAAVRPVVVRGHTGDVPGFPKWLGRPGLP